jgi:hypothetical protein
VAQYQSVFKPLIHLEAEYDRAMKEAQSRDNITVRCGRGLAAGGNLAAGEVLSADAAPQRHACPRGHRAGPQLLPPRWGTGTGPPGHAGPSVQLAARQGLGPPCTQPCAHARCCCRWDTGLNKKRLAYFFFARDDTEYKLMPGDELKLRHRHAGSRGAWEGVGHVTLVGGVCGAWVGRCLWGGAAR